MIKLIDYVLKFISNLNSTIFKLMYNLFDKINISFCFVYYTISKYNIYIIYSVLWNNFAVIPFFVFLIFSFEWFILWSRFSGGKIMSENIWFEGG